jgi:hypothetical protein
VSKNEDKKTPLTVSVLFALQKSFIRRHEFVGTEKTVVATDIKRDRNKKSH